METLELFAREVMPEFAERHEGRERAKAARLEPVIAAVMARKPAQRPSAARPRLRDPRLPAPRRRPRGERQVPPLARRLRREGRRRRRRQQAARLTAGPDAIPFALSEGRETASMIPGDGGTSEPEVGHRHARRRLGDGARPARDDDRRGDRGAVLDLDRAGHRAGVRPGHPELRGGVRASPDDPDHDGGFGTDRRGRQAVPARRERAGTSRARSVDRGHRRRPLLLHPVPPG